MASKNSRKARKVAAAAEAHEAALSADLCHNCAWNHDARWLHGSPCDSCQDNDRWICSHKASVYCEHECIRTGNCGTFCVDVRTSGRCPIGEVA